MDLCTVISENFIPQAINLIQSYRVNSYDDRIYLYHFNTPAQKLEIFKQLFSDQVTLIEIESDCEHAFEPRVFFYKAYAISHCLENYSECMIYSDSANCFIKNRDIKADLIDGSLFMPYNDPKLVNEYWTTARCFEKMNIPGSKLAPQYWAGFQAYERTEENIKFVKEMLRWMEDPDVAFPDTTVRYPDGESSKCIEHRQDQSVLSLLIHKYNKHQTFEPDRNDRYGDWQTMVDFNPRHKPNFDNTVLSPRESKFGRFRFIRHE